MAKHSVLYLGKQSERRREIRRCQHDLRYLAGKMGYDWDPVAQQGVTDHFHGALCTRMDRLHHHKRVLTITPRKTLKSTIFTICWTIQQLMIDPDQTILICHAIDEVACDMVKEIGNLMKFNEYLRSLEPIGRYPEGHSEAGQEFRITPLAKEKKWLLSDRFTITQRPGMKQTTRRQPSVSAKGAGSEITGRHVDTIILDDIIGLATLEDGSGMARIRRWWKATILNVLNAGGRVRAVGTRWDADDIWSDFLSSKDWDSLVRHAREHPKTGKMDYKRWRPCHWGEAFNKHGRLSIKEGLKQARAREEQELREMGPADYGAQRMNDPTPAGTIPWVRENEQFTNFMGMDDRPAADGPGTTFVLTDPAPRAVSQGDGEKKRGDGSKDYWSICVVKLRPLGHKNLIFLLDGAHSQDWTVSEGLEVCRGFMERYRTPYFFVEQYGFGHGEWTERMMAICNQSGTPLYRDKGLLPKYNQGYAYAAKSQRVGALADRNDRGEFYIVEDTCDHKFLYGDGEHTGFLTQVRKFRPLPNGKNSLRWDDDVDCVSRATDSKLQRMAPTPEYEPKWRQELEWYHRQERRKQSFRRNRHIAM